MRLTLKFATAAAVAALAAVATSLPASAACTRLGFSVNDYGKDGPTNDAKSLLDKYIAKKMAERGVSKYTTGKKDVTCELFLNFIVFDEHTCKAEATVCWDGTALPKGETAAVDGATVKPAEKPKADAKSDSKSATVAKPKDVAKPAEVAKAPEPVKPAEPEKAVEKAAAPAEEAPKAAAQ